METEQQGSVKREGGGGRGGEGRRVMCCEDPRKGMGALRARSARRCGRPGAGGGAPLTDWAKGGKHSLRNTSRLLVAPAAAPRLGYIRRGTAAAFDACLVVIHHLDAVVAGGGEADDGAAGLQ
jgi:hypothetical protein